MRLRSWRLMLSVLLGSLATQASADQIPPGCLGSAGLSFTVFCVVSDNVTNYNNGQTVAVGDTIYYQARLSHSIANLCAVSDGVILITTPDGVTTDATPDVGIPLVCGSIDCPLGAVATVFSKAVPYTVRAADVGVSQTGFDPCLPSPVGRIQAAVSYTCGTLHCNESDDCEASGELNICNAVVIPSIEIEELVACTTNVICDASLAYSNSVSCVGFAGTDPMVCYSITITNTGTAVLVVTNVSDDVLGALPLTGGIRPNEGVTFFFGPVSLPSTITNHVTVLAYAPVGCYRSVDATASATVTVLRAEIPISSPSDLKPLKIGKPTKFRGMVDDDR